MPPLSPSAKREIGYGPTTRSFLVKNLIFASTRQLRPPWLLRLNRTTGSRSVGTTRARGWFARSGLRKTPDFLDRRPFQGKAPSSLGMSDAAETPGCSVQEARRFQAEAGNRGSAPTSAIR